MNRKLRPVKSFYPTKGEQVNFLLEDIEKNLEEYEKIIESKERQLVKIKKNTSRSKK